MSELSLWLSLAGFALGGLGGVLVFLEFFQTPSYAEYNRSHDQWIIDRRPRDVSEYTWFGRVGALLIGLGFALLFLATLIE